MTEKKYNILLVDDEENILHSLRRLFRKEPYNLILARNSDEGIEKLSLTEVQLIISDYRMPGKNGVQFLREVKKLYPNSIRMVLSGYADINAIINAVNEGEIYKFLTKPWNDDELKVTVRRAIEQYELQKENLALTRELKALNRDLERKVEERTKELQLRNAVLLHSQEIMERLPFAVIGIDTEGVVSLMNEKGRTLFSREGFRLGGKIGHDFTGELAGLVNGDGPDKEVKIERFGIGDKEYDVTCVSLPAHESDGVRGYIMTFIECER